jgi:hypothetical protein
MKRKLKVMNEGETWGGFDPGCNPIKPIFLASYFSIFYILSCCYTSILGMYVMFDM